ncbi:MAG: hypothetical protein ACE5Q6_04755 [Dehalococcoidia bacterium]
MTNDNPPDQKNDELTEEPVSRTLSNLSFPLVDVVTLTMSSGNTIQVTTPSRSSDYSDFIRELAGRLAVWDDGHQIFYSEAKELVTWLGQIQDPCNKTELLQACISRAQDLSDRAYRLGNWAALIEELIGYELSKD